MRMLLLCSTLCALFLVALPEAAYAQLGTRGLIVPPPPSDDPTAHILVRVPDGAHVEFEGIRTKQTGELRHFQSPPLPFGRKFTYRLKATWKDGDRLIERERKVEVQAGEYTSVDLSVPTSPR